MVDYTWRGNARVTPYMAYQLDRLDADLRRLFGVGLVANSGIRIPQEQIDIFLQRYVTAGNVNGRKVYDTRWWNGQLWYRISAAGTVAAPGSSNHEIQGTKAAVDIADTGSDAGITSKNSVRGRWIRANAPNYDLVASGDSFGEGWHFDINNIFAAVPGQPSGGGGTVFPTKKESNSMVHAAWRDASGTIAIQCVPGGRITMLEDPYDWLGIYEGSRTGYAQVSNEQFQAIIARYGTVKYPSFDTGAAASQLAIVIPLEGGDSRYFMVGERIFPLHDTGTMGAIEAQGVPYFSLPQVAIDSMIDK